jgi:hypothetical protein
MELVKRDTKFKSVKKYDYTSVIGYLKRNRIYMDIKTQVRFGKIARRICEEKVFPIKQTSNKRFGQVNTYPYFILEIAYNQINNPNSF